MVRSDEQITIARSDLGPALVLLQERLAEHYTPAQLETALWHWLQQATTALVQDSDTYALRGQRGFLTRAFDDALRQL